MTKAAEADLLISAYVEDACEVRIMDSKLGVMEAFLFFQGLPMTL